MKRLSAGQSMEIAHLEAVNSLDEVTVFVRRQKLVERFKRKVLAMRRNVLRQDEARQIERDQPGVVEAVFGVLRKDPNSAIDAIER